MPEHTIHITVDGDTTFEQLQQALIDSFSVRYSHISITDINFITVLPHSTVKQYLEEHPEIQQPYLFQLNLLLDGD